MQRPRGRCNNKRPAVGAFGGRGELIRSTSWQTLDSTGTQRSVLSLPSGTWMAHWLGPRGRKQSTEIGTFADAHAGVPEE